MPGFISLLIAPFAPAGAHGRKPQPRRRGMALLLVMIGMVVCSILTAGFLASQGTSIGIARNERDAQKCRVLAQTGIDMCYWLIRNKSDWRETMPIGTWLNALPVGDGTVTVTAADGDSSGSLSDNPAQADVVLTATGAYDNRTIALTATIRPTGGGTVFSAGNFVNGSMTVGDSDFSATATVDSYDSSVSAYSLPAGSNANFTTNSITNHGFTLYAPSAFQGSFTGNPSAVLASILYLVNNGGTSPTGPTATSNATEIRVAPSVLTPNVTGIQYRGSHNKTSINPGINAFPGPGRYDAVSANAATITINSSGLYYVTGNLSLATATATLNVATGTSAIVVVDGSVTITGKITLTGTGTLALYCNNPATINNNVNIAGTTSQFTLFGTPSCSQIILNNGCTVVGSIFAPQAAFIMQTSAPKFYGAVFANSLTIKNGSRLHFDEALRSMRISNVTGGSASPGSAEYSISVTGGPGL